MTSAALSERNFVTSGAIAYECRVDWKNCIPAKTVVNEGSQMMMQPTQITTTVPAGAVTLVILKLIDQAPAILTALGVLMTALVGLLNFRRLGEVKSQTDGHM